MFNKEYAIGQDKDDMEDTIMRLCKGHNFSVLHCAWNHTFNACKIKVKCKEVLQFNRITNRRNIDYNASNEC